MRRTVRILTVLLALGIGGSLFLRRPATFTQTHVAGLNQSNISPPQCFGRFFSPPTTVIDSPYAFTLSSSSMVIQNNDSRVTIVGLTDLPAHFVDDNPAADYFLIPLADNEPLFFDPAHLRLYFAAFIYHRDCFPGPAEVTQAFYVYDLASKSVAESFDLAGADISPAFRYALLPDYALPAARDPVCAGLSLGQSPVIDLATNKLVARINTGFRYVRLNGWKSEHEYSYDVYDVNPLGNDRFPLALLPESRCRLREHKTESVPPSSSPSGLTD